MERHQDAQRPLLLSRQELLLLIDGARLSRRVRDLLTALAYAPARPTLELLAARCGVHKRTVQRAIAEAEAAGVLQVIVDRGRESDYRILAPGLRLAARGARNSERGTEAAFPLPAPQTDPRQTVTRATLSPVTTHDNPRQFVAGGPSAEAAIEPPPREAPPIFARSQAGSGSQLPPPAFDSAAARTARGTAVATRGRTPANQEQEISNSQSPNTQPKKPREAPNTVAPCNGAPPYEPEPLPAGVTAVGDALLEAVRARTSPETSIGGWMERLLDCCNAGLAPGDSRRLDPRLARQAARLVVSGEVDAEAIEDLLDALVALRRAKKLTSPGGFFHARMVRIAGQGWRSRSPPVGVEV